MPHNRSLIRTFRPPTRISFPFLPRDEEEYSDDDEVYSDDDGAPTLFIDSGNNKDSPDRNAGKPVILASAAPSESGDDGSILGTSADFEGMYSSRSSGGRSRQTSIATGGGGRGNTRRSDGHESISGLVAGEASLAKVVEEGPVMADANLMSLPSLDITGEGGARVIADD